MLRCGQRSRACCPVLAGRRGVGSSADDDTKFGPSVRRSPEAPFGAGRGRTGRPIHRTLTKDAGTTPAEDGEAGPVAPAPAGTVWRIGSSQRPRSVDAAGRTVEIASMFAIRGLRTFVRTHHERGQARPAIDHPVGCRSNPRRSQDASSMSAPLGSAAQGLQRSRCIDHDRSSIVRASVLPDPGPPADLPSPPPSPPPA